MLATAAPAVPPAMAAPLDLDHDRGPQITNGTSPRQFKRHKALPRPRDTRGPSAELAPSKQPALHIIDTSAPAFESHGLSAPSRKHQSMVRADNVPELPPTPPIHSRTSSSSHAALPSSPTLPDIQIRTPRNATTNPPTTPPDQRSPPTPDVTPPQPATRPKALRPPHMERNLSKSTQAESRTDSFRTAREEPMSSGEEDGKSTIRAAGNSGRTSQATVRKASDTSNSRVPHPKALDLALASLTGAPEDSYTPRTRSELAQFDGDWGSASEVEREWDDNLNRTITVKKRQPARPKAQPVEKRRDIVDDARLPMASNNATKAVRQMSLNDKASPKSSKSHTGRMASSSSGPSNSSSSVTTSQKRSSGVSSRSFSSAVVEAFLIETPQQSPQRQRTLRHVRKQSALRDPIDQPAEPVAAPVERGRTRPPVANTRPDRTRHESYASNTTVSSVASGKARREIWKSGGIPVVVVPDRRSSRSQSREPSLRSTSSRRSKRTQSMSSAPLDTAVTKEAGPVFDRPRRRSRAYSLSDSSDTRTIDFPPAIPARSSSLSAPTSRNTSRAASLTADSLRARDAIHRCSQSTSNEEEESPILRNDPVLGTASWDKPPTAKPKLSEPAEKSRQPKDVKKDEPKLLSPLFLSPLQFPSPKMSSPKIGSDTDGRFDSDRHDDGFSAKKYSVRNTPFSIVSVETNGTAPEVSEAQAVHMYAHQNSSLVMVNHSARPSQTSDIMRPDKELLESGEQPIITATGPDGEAPVTPPQPQFSLEDVDSPLRNPRAPPEPPTEPPAEPPFITFTSATPSGATPAPDKAIALGNYFETMAEVPKRRTSLVQRAFSRRGRETVQYPPNSSRSQGFLSRTFSLTRSRSSSRRRHLTPNSDYPQEDDIPPEEQKLHAFWRPQWWDEFDEEYDYEDRGRPRDEDDEYLKYPLVDNRPAKPRRRFSEKMKRTFAVLPIRDEEDYRADNGNGPERRTIRRTSSGNLKVMRRRNSASSLRRRFSQPERPYTAPDEDYPRSFWRSNSVHRRVPSQSRRRFSLSGRLEDIQNIPRRLSEKRREKRTKELRQKISGPRDVRDGVIDVIRSGSTRDHERTGQHLI